MTHAPTPGTPSEPGQNAGQDPDATDGKAPIAADSDGEPDTQPAEELDES